MIIGKALKAQLTGDADVNAIIAGRIYPQIAPEGGAYPAIVYAGDAADEDQTYDGPSGLVSQTVKVTCMGATYAAATDLANKARRALSGQSGTWGGIRVQGCFYRDEDEYDAPLPELGPDAVIYVNELEFLIWFDMP